MCLIKLKFMINQILKLSKKEDQLEGVMQK